MTAMAALFTQAVDDNGKQQQQHQIMLQTLLNVTGQWKTGMCPICLKDMLLLKLSDEMRSVTTASLPRWKEKRGLKKVFWKHS